MLKRDEMKEIIGGCGSYNSCGDVGLQGFGGGTAIGSTFGGVPYAGYSNPVVNSYYGTAGSSSSSNSSSTTNNNTGSTWATTADGFTTTNKSEINRFYEYMTGQSNGQNIANFNPSIFQISTFLSQEMQFAALSGTNQMPDGTIIQLPNVDVYQISDPTHPSYNPYAAFNTAENIAGILYNMVNSISGAGSLVTGVGVVLTATVVGAEVGIPLMIFGGYISNAGTAGELALDMYGNTWETFDGEKWVIKAGFKAASMGFSSWDVPSEQAKALYEGWSMASENWIETMRIYNP